MPNEIYHRRNWGESKAEGFGDVYYDHAATNKLYNHSDYYENSDGTDATLKDLNNKASIVLTPTAYSDGSLNTVIPPYQETLKFSGFSSFSVGSSWEVENDVATTDGLTFSNLSSPTNVVVGKKYRAVFTITGGSVRFYFGGSGDTPYTVAAGTHTLIGVAESNKVTFRNLSTASSISNFTLIELQEADFDFSRGSSATRVNEQGLVEDVQILSGELVQNGNFEQIGSELVTNGNFDTDTDWTKGTGWTIADSSASYDASGTSALTSASTSIVSGKIYRLKFKITTSGFARLNFTTDGSQSLFQPNGNSLNNFADGEYTFYLSAQNNSTALKIFAYNVSGGTSFSIENVSVKEVGQNWTFGSSWSMGDGVAISDGGASYLTSSGPSRFTSGKKYRVSLEIVEYNSGTVSLPFDASGVNANYQNSAGVKTADIIAVNNNSPIYIYSSGFNGTIDNVSVKEVTDDTDLPRIDFTDGTGSLLLEPQRTNKITYSENFSIWSTNEVTLESGYTAPDGSTNAYKVTRTGTSAYVVLSGGLLGTDARTIYARTVSGSGDVKLTSHNLNTNNLFTVTEEWQRFEVNSAPQVGTNFYAVDFRGAGTTLTEVILWGAQCEVGDYATSYIPTSGSTVTRSADVANNSGNADLFNDSEGVLYAEIAALADDSTYRQIAISDGTTDNRIALMYTNASNSIRSQVRVSASNQFDQTTTAYTITENNKIAIKYKANDFALWINGVQVFADTSGTTPTGLNELAFDDGAGNNDFYGNTKAVAVFKEALSNDLLERLTGEGYESFRLLAEANNYTII